MSCSVFRKYKALFPEVEVKPYVKEFNAIDAIYILLNQNVKTVDLTKIMMHLQTWTSNKKGKCVEIIRTKRGSIPEEYYTDKWNEKSDIDEVLSIIVLWVQTK